MSLLPPARQRSRLRRWFEQVSSRLARSARVFLAVLLVLIAVEVAVDWNSTLFEINVLRGALQLKAESFADLLRNAGERALLAKDTKELERLSQGVFDDEEVVYVRFSDAEGRTVYDRLRPDFAKRFADTHRKPFLDTYRHPMERDIPGMLRDPAELRARMEKSRHRDFIQAFTDTQGRVIAWITRRPPQARSEKPRVLFQDRLQDDKRTIGRDVSYSLGVIDSSDGRAEGLVLVAFSNAQLEADTSSKLWKGAAVTLFFVCLILVQNLSSRRGQLRMQKLEEALGAARAAVRSALPEAPALPAAFSGWEVGIGFSQAQSLGGTVYDVSAEGDQLLLFLAVPEGAGVDAALASLALIDAWRRALGGADLQARLEDTLAGYARSPLHRRVALLVLALSANGAVSGASAGLDAPLRLVAGRAAPLAVTEPLPLDCEGKELLLTPPLRFTDGASGAPLVIWDDGVPPLISAAALAFEERSAHVATDEIAAALAHSQGARDAAESAVARVDRQRKKGRAEDLFLFVARMLRT